MRTKFKTILMVLIFLILSYVIYEKVGPELSGAPLIEKTDDASVFKKEYESLNGELNSNGVEYMSIQIPEENRVEYIDELEVINIIEEGTGVIYLGYPECPWCRSLLPVLLSALDNMGIDKLYYYNPKEIRDTKSLDEEGNIVVDKEGSNEYYEIVNLLNDYLLPYNGLEDETIKRLYVPAVVFIRDGEVIGVHTSTLASQTDPYVELNEEQNIELTSILEKYINDVYQIICDEDC